MTTSSLTLADFILDRITEDEAAAHAVGVPVWASLIPDPARVLAQRAAFRGIVEMHRSCDDVFYGDGSTCPELRALASIWSAHPAYRPEWKA